MGEMDTGYECRSVRHNCSVRLQVRAPGGAASSPLMPLQGLFPVVHCHFHPLPLAHAVLHAEPPP